MESEFRKVCHASEIADGERLLTEVDDRLVILFRVGYDYYCIDDVCSHDGGTLGDGEHSGFEIECPRHGARFDIRCGKALCMPATQSIATHEVNVDNEEIYVRICED